MKKQSDRLCRQAIETAMEYYNRETWVGLEPAMAFAIKIPILENPVTVFPMGQGGEQFGIHIILGDQQLENVEVFLSGVGYSDDDEGKSKLHLAGYSIDLLEDIPIPFRSILNRARIQLRRESYAPFFIVKEPYKKVRLPNDRELKMMIWITNGLLKAVDEEMLELHDPLEDGTLQLITVSGNIALPDVEYSEYTLSKSKVIPMIPLVEFPTKLSKLKRMPGNFIVAFAELPIDLKDVEYAQSILLAFNETDDKILCAQVINSNEIQKAAQHLFTVFNGNNLIGWKGLPSSIIFTHRELTYLASPHLESLGVTCKYQKHHPLMESLLRDLEEHAFNEDSQRIISEAAKPDNLEFWKKCDHALITMGMDSIADILKNNSNLMYLYYGKNANINELYDEFADSGFEESYNEWLWMDYRLRKNMKTMAEKMLDQQIPGQLQELLQNRIAAKVSLYRVEDVDKKSSTIRLKDIFTGIIVNINDVMLSNTIEIDIILPLRVYKAGAFNFISLAGAPIPKGAINDALVFLMKIGLTAIERDQAHYFGHLWEWLYHYQQHPLILVNRDDHIILLHEAKFQIQDKEKVKRVLKDAPDYDYNVTPNEMVWFRDVEDELEFLGRRLILGNLNFKKDILTLQVNSRERFEIARQHLEAIEGVVFKNVKVKKVMDEISQLHSSEPRKLVFDATFLYANEIDKLKKAMHNYYLAWIDRPLPILENKTPREFCRTKAGRLFVKAIIHSMKEMDAEPGDEIPADEMFNLLGI